MIRDTDILKLSPLDNSASSTTKLVQLGGYQTPRWVASRYNVRATTEDGRLILWNSFSGSMSVFRADQKSSIVKLLSKRPFQAKKEGIVRYLVDRGFLVREGTDEFRRVQYAFGQEHYRTDALELILLASEDCNFRCTYCYEAFARGTMQPEVRASIKKLVESRLPLIRRLYVSWFGGEPLYGFPAIAELAPFFVQVSKQHELTFGSHMTTNGYLLSPAVADKLLAWQIRDYQITIDGTPEDHDRHRPARDGGKTFETIFSNLRSLGQRRDDFAVTIRINFDQENHPRLESFLDQVESVFRDDPRFSISFHAIGRWGGPNDASLAVCGHEEVTRVKALLKQAARQRGLNISGTLSEVQGPGSQVCYAARPHNFIIGAAGQVMKCTIALDKEDYNVVGYLRNDGQLELDQDKMALWTEPAFESDEMCRKCVILPTCQGVHCPKIRLEENRRPCPGTRLNAKEELLEMLKGKEANARRVEVRRRSA